MTKRAGRKLLILSNTCDGEDVGESWSTFQWVKGLSKHWDVTLLTYTRYGHTPTSIQLPDIRVVEWNDFPGLQRFERFSAALKPGWWLLYWRARHWIRKQQKAGEHFDLIHQISPLGLRHACPASGLGIPYIVGPLAGSMETPCNFKPEVKGPWYSRARNLDRFRFKYDPLLRTGLSNAEVVIGVAPYVAQILEDIPIKQFEFQSETGVTCLPAEKNDAGSGNTPLRLLYVGRIVRTKGLRDAIRALLLLSHLNFHLDVVGDGEDRSQCEHEAQPLLASGRIRFHGKLPRSDVDRFYQKSDVFLFPSFREPSGNVVLEALSFGLPIITATTGGPGYTVSDGCGFRVPPNSPADYAQELSRAIERIATDRELLRSLGQGARQLISENYIWEKKVAWMLKLYDRIVAR